MPAVLPTLESASLSDIGRLRLTHEDACHCDPHLGLFVVCDGLGGRPSGEAASQIICYSLGHLLRRRIRTLKSLDVAKLKEILIELAVDISDQMRTLADQIPSLRGMGATLSALLIDGRNAFIIHAGDSRVYLLREGQFSCLTTDHFRMGSRPATAVDQMTHPHLSVVNQRLLTQFVGIGRPLEPEVVHLHLKRGDRLLLCTDGLTDPVPESEIARIVSSPDLTLEQICAELVAFANANGGPDNITVALVEYEKLRLVEFDELRASVIKPKSGRPIGASTKFHAALLDLQKDLDWLRAGVKEAKKSDRIEAFAAIKQRLGGLEFEHFMQQHSSQSPAHVFHRAVTGPGSSWREHYVEHQSALIPHLNTIIDHAIRLSPVMTGQESAMILATLWRDWQRVEERYLAICRRDPFNPADHPLEVLIELMHGSVSTMIGLMEFFPRFMRGRT